MEKYKGGLPRPDIVQPAKCLKNLFDKIYDRKIKDIEVDTRLRPNHNFLIFDQSIIEAKVEEED